MYPVTHKPMGLFPILGGSSGRVVALGLKINAIKDIAQNIRVADIPAAISVPDALKLADLATKAMVEFAQVSAKAASEAPEIRDRIESSRRAVQEDYKRMIVGRILDAANRVGSGGGLNGPIIVANVGLFLDHLAGGYEALVFFEKIRPGFLSILPSSVMRVIVDIAEFVAKIAKFVTKALEDAIDNGKKFVLTLVDILKWGSVAGGLYLLYKVLEPEGKK